MKLRMVCFICTSKQPGQKEASVEIRPHGIFFCSIMEIERVNTPYVPLSGGVAFTHYAK